MIIIKKTIKRLMSGLGLKPYQIRWLISKTGLYPYLAPATRKVSFGKRLKAHIFLQKAWQDWKKIDRPKLASLKDIHRDKERCFIIGNGPSLNRLDLKLLKDEITFGVNNIFLNFNKMGFKPTYYVAEDILVAEDRAQEINKLSGTVKFFPFYLSYCLKKDENTIYLNHCSFQCTKADRSRVFSLNPSEYTCGGFTVLYTCLQLAFHMGFRKIYLLGVDLDYQEPKDFHYKPEYNRTVITSTDQDPNHFHPDYFGKGYRWHKPDLDEMRESFREAKKVYETYGRKIYNATAGGKLELFKRVDYKSLFK